MGYLLGSIFDRLDLTLYLFGNVNSNQSVSSVFHLAASDRKVTVPDDAADGTVAGADDAADGTKVTKWNT